MSCRWLWLGLVLALLGCTAPVLVPTPTMAPVSGPPQRVQIAASDTLEPVLRALGAAYQRENSAVQVMVLRRADLLAWSMLQKGEVDLAALAWLPDDLPEGTWVQPLARDGLAILVNSQNGIPGITMEQLQTLFQGRAEDWSPWGGLPGTPVLVTREDAAGETLLFMSRVMGDLPMALTALVAPTSSALLEAVAQEPLAVGYGSTARLKDNVRALAVDGIPPAPEMLVSGLYPLTRNIVLVARLEPEGALAQFGQWVSSEQAKNVILQQGFLLPSAP